MFLDRLVGILAPGSWLSLSIGMIAPPSYQEQAPIVKDGQRLPRETSQRHFDISPAHVHSTTRVRRTTLEFAQDVVAP